MWILEWLRVNSVAIRTWICCGLVFGVLGTALLIYATCLVRMAIAEPVDCTLYSTTHIEPTSTVALVYSYPFDGTTIFFVWFTTVDAPSPSSYMCYPTLRKKPQDPPPASKGYADAAMLALTLVVGILALGFVLALEVRDGRATFKFTSVT